MTTIELLSNLRELKVRLWVEEGQLRFSAPRGALSAPLREKIKARKPEIISFLEESQAMAQQGQPQIEVVSRDGELPLSFAQQRLWFLDQLQPGDAAYNLPIAVKLRGALDVPALQASLQQLATRHESLRTTFPMRDGVATQAISSGCDVELTLIPLSGDADQTSAMNVRSIVSEQARRPFDLEQGPLFRASLISSAPDEFVLLLCMHHIVSDGWSVGVVLRELTAIYGAVCDKQPTSLAESTLQYADYAAWQQDWFRGEYAEKQLAYWKTTLGDGPAVLEVPTDRPRRAVQTSNGDIESLMLPDELAAKLRGLCQQEEVTLFMLLLAAFKILLAHYCGTKDISVGTPIAGRNRSALEGIVGCFVNTLVLRTSLTGNPSFRELLQRVKETALGAFSHQEFPFEKLVLELNPDRDTSHSPLFQVMFVYQNAPPEQFSVELPGLELSRSGVERRTSNFDLSLIALDDANGLRISFEYNSDLFQADTIRRILRQLETLLEDIVARPGHRVSQLSLLKHDERLELIQRWNDTRSLTTDTACIHELVSEQAQKSPDATAVVDGDQQISFAVLDSRSSQLARYLATNGVTAECRVGIACDRSIEMVVAVLGVLKSGAAYVPLDPNYPSSQLAFMIRDADVSTILTTTSQLAGFTTLRDEIATDRQLPIVDIQGGWSAIAGFAATAPNIEVESRNLAYIIYTSGSTGQPKGVMIEHRSVVNHTRAVQSTFAIDERDRVLQFATLNFDAAVEEIFPTLSTGACLVLRPGDSFISVTDLKDVIAHQQLTFVDLPTVFWHQWTNELEAESTHGSLRLVVLGGDKAEADALQRWRSALGDRVRIVNTYGPTETTVISTAYDCEPLLQGTSAPDTDVDVPIGTPILNTSNYVLTPDLALSPFSANGELHIGGLPVARGYVNRPEITAERFIPDDFGGQRGCRLYRSGDLVRYRADGNLEFVGRSDQQVKIRGFRVEPGGVERAILQHPNVCEAVVVARTLPTSSNKRLIAYYVTDGGELTSDALVSFLRTQLPEYMLPAVCEACESLPKTLSGKIDKQALPEPGVVIAMDATVAVPETKTEVLLAEIWQEILGIQSIGIHDNFFSLGGDSIIAIQLISKARQRGLELKPIQLFRNQTIAELARAMGEPSSQRIEAQQTEVTGQVELTPIQRWFFDSGSRNPSHWNQSILLTVPPDVDVTALKLAAQHLQKHHDALRMRFQQHADSWEQFARPDEAIQCFTTFDLSLIRIADHADVIESLASSLQASLDISEGPIFRVAYFDLGRELPGRLMIVAHHLVVDGVAWRVLLEDLQTLYQQAAGDLELSLPAKTTSFQYWAKRLHEHAQSSKVIQESEYWLESGNASVAPLPTDGDGPNVESSAQTVANTLDVEETRKLLQDVPAAYNTEINDILLTSLAKALARWTGKRSFLVDLEGHGREPIFDDVDLSRTVGWFTTTVPVLLDLGKTVTPKDAIVSVKEQLRRIPHRGIGFGLLRHLCEEPTVARRMAALPSPQISFNYFGQLDQHAPGDAAFGVAAEPRGPEQNPTDERACLVDIIASVRGQRLQVRFRFSRNLYQQSTMEQLSAWYFAELRSLILHCTGTEQAVQTASDFKLAGINQDQLGKVLAQLKPAK